MYTLGILLSFCALFAWGFGDFFIQKTVRVVGNVEALFYICVFASVILLPFLNFRLLPHSINFYNIFLLSTLSLIMLATAFIEFEALKIGKIAVIEPLLGIELPLTVFFSVLLKHEHLNLLESLLIASTFLGIVLTATRDHLQLHYHRRILEKGVLLAAIGALGLALINYMVGIESQNTSAIFTIWFTSVALSLVCLGIIVSRGQALNLIKHFVKFQSTIWSVSILDNIAWLAYAFAVILIPISIATTISESYIGIGVILGLLINREKIRRHQVIGICVSVLAIIILSAISKA